MITNCPNCSAPLNKDGYCEYCGTRTRYANKTEINMLRTGEIIDLSLVFKSGNDNIVLPLQGCIEAVEHRIDTYSMGTARDIRLFGAGALLGHEVKFTFRGYTKEADEK